ncbi:MAG: hypothetical protein B6244_01320 [Candidatus Cloacimonetes bacterium 4572_55]|nr:MAG: hypothetical protein B6244_01320 [Candidatus Cloacimonetes bacterium 4572_55]
MNDARLDFLLSPRGQVLLKKFADTPITPELTLKLSRQFPRSEITPVTEILGLRQRALKKFRCADKMYFDRVGMEQASSDLTAEYHAARFADYFGKSSEKRMSFMIADICCGIGSDSIALAKKGFRLISIDNDPLRLRLFKQNVAAYGLERQIDTICADVRNQVPKADGIFIDPDRRPGGSRTISLHEMTPSIDILPKLREATPHIGMKLTPMVSLRKVPSDCEIEFVSVNRECREALFWFGGLKSAVRRATILSEGGCETFCRIDGEDEPYCETGEPGQFLYEPNGAIIRAQLTDKLGCMLNARRIDPDLSLLTSNQHIPTRFAVCFKIEKSFPFQLKRLKRWLKQQDAGQVTIHRRGFPMTLDQIKKQLSTKGTQSLSLFLTTVSGDHWVFQVRKLP